MAVFENDVDPRGRKMREVFTRKLLQRVDHRFAVALLHRLAVGAEFGVAAVGIHQHARKGLNQTDKRACKDVRKAVVDLREAEGRVERGIAHRKPNRRREQEQVADVHDLHFQHVLVETVAKLVREDRADLVGGHRIDEVIVQHDGFHLTEAGKIRVQLGGSSRRVHYLDRLDLIAVRFKERQEASLQLPVLERNELVRHAAEYGIEERDRQRDEEDHARKEENHRVLHPLMKNAQKLNEGDIQNKLENDRADAVDHEGLYRRAVKAVFFFNAHRTDIGEDRIDDRADARVKQNNGEQLQKHIARKKRSKGRVKIRGQQNQTDRTRHRSGDQTEAVRFPAVFPPAEIGLLVINVADVLRDRILRRAKLNDRKEQAVGNTDEGEDDDEWFKH